MERSARFDPIFLLIRSSTDGHPVSKSGQTDAGASTKAFRVCTGAASITGNPCTVQRLGGKLKPCECGAQSVSCCTAITTGHDAGQVMSVFCGGFHQRRLCPFRVCLLFLLALFFFVPIFLVSRSISRFFLFGHLCDCDSHPPPLHSLAMSASNRNRT